MQKSVYGEEYKKLSNNQAVNKSRKILKLNRLNFVDVSNNERHPFILPSKHSVTKLIIKTVHNEVGHQGIEHVLAKLREKYWVIAGSSAVRSVIKDCFVCKKFQSVPQNQLMANIPIERAAAAQPPFTDCGVDYFGSIYVKIKRSQVKRYGVIFPSFIQSSSF